MTDENMQTEDAELNRDTAVLINTAILELTGGDISTVDIFREDLLRTQPVEVPLEWFERYRLAIRMAQTLAHTIAQDALTATNDDTKAAIDLVNRRFGQ